MQAGRTRPRIPQGLVCVTAGRQLIRVAAVWANGANSEPRFKLSGCMVRQRPTEIHPQTYVITSKGKNDLRTQRGTVLRLSRLPDIDAPVPCELRGGPAA